ncbi:hypothetical protein CASFOL_019521 [Castilleja foliolosa]|uniref:Uncharacterized protein n=1 Tax=Castilleja foliolosa TaxID=1961234 RepID=A0ABD3D6A1_9LAMI
MEDAVAIHPCFDTKSPTEFMMAMEAGDCFSKMDKEAGDCCRAGEDGACATACLCELQTPRIISSGF